MLDGICLRIIEIKKLENAVTKVNATLITSAFATLVVTANAEQIPKICRAIGLLSKIGEVKIVFVSAMLCLLTVCCWHYCDQFGCGMRLRSEERRVGKEC